MDLKDCISDFRAYRKMESSIKKMEDDIINLLQECMKESFNIDFENLKIDSGKSKKVDFKCIFCYNCWNLGVSTISIGKRINKHHSTVFYYINKYEDLYEYDKDFRELADRFNNKLKEIQDGTNE